MSSPAGQEAAAPAAADPAGSVARPVTVVIVDDHRSFAELLASALGNVPGLTCVGVATTAAEGIALVTELTPTVVVMDIQMPDQDGLIATRRIRDIAPDTVVAVVTAHHDPQWVAKAAQAGASAFIPKDGSLDDMIDMLQRVQHGQMLVGQTTFSSAPLSSPGPVDDAPVPLLTHREMEVLTCLGQGMQVQGIARALGISLHTCRGYVKSLHTKLGVRTQLEAVIKAHQVGLLGPTG